MDVTLFEWGQFLTLLLIALALGADAFSLGVGVGMTGMRLKKIAKVSLTIGLFHVAMPLIGIFIGIYLSEIVGDIAVMVGGLILIAMGLHMLWNVFYGDDEEDKSMKTTGFGLFLFAFSVSLDALSVGFSLGLMEINKLLAVTMFGIAGGGMAAAGMMLGRRMGNWLGEYSEVLGGLILVIFGIKFIL
ncbi:manganese efflux pump MntP [Brevibacillus dissolubilis]|uniref:manganese efflux pump MntP n=1 Tax=Brevibacillus dissolubilis TaxID=1844116 RepID=UPI001116EC1A|nr:manganese efflux pump MntP family protein [Brevibacillus dissolubilis]